MPPPSGGPADRSAQQRKAPQLLDGLYRFLPPYSPDMNPIEPAWAKVKAALRRVGARTAEALHQARGPARDAIAPRDAAGFFRHCGYSRPE